MAKYKNSTLGSMDKVSVCISVPRSLLARVGEVTRNRSVFFCDAVREKLAGRCGDSASKAIPVIDDEAKVKGVEFSGAETEKVLKHAKTLGDMLDGALLEVFAKKKDLLESMNDSDLAKLVASRLPKREDENRDLEGDVLSLSDSIGMLPSMEDITQELLKVKGLLLRTRSERDSARSQIRFLERKDSMEEFMTRLYSMMVEYVVDLVARNDLPGLGDGGGLDAKSYTDIANKVRRDMMSMKIWGSEYVPKNREENKSE